MYKPKLKSNSDPNSKAAPAMTVIIHADCKYVFNSIIIQYVNKSKNLFKFHVKSYPLDMPDLTFI